MAFVKRAYGRTKQKTLQSVGRRDATVDIGFNQSVERFKAHYKVMEKFLKDLREYIKAFKTLGLAQTALNEGIGSFYDHTSTLNLVNEKNKQCALLLDQYRQNLDENIDRDVVAPLNAHMGTYKILKKRVAERDRRVTDYDRFKAEVKALTVNPNSKPEKVHEAQHNLAVSKHAYEVLEAELMQDMEALHNDRLSFFDPCFAVILNMQHGYYAEGYKLFSELVAMVSHVDPASIHSHVAPITPEEFTMANPKNVTPPEMEAYAPPPTQQYGDPQGGGYATSPAPPRGGSQFGQPQPYQPPQEHTELPLNMEPLREAEAIWPLPPLSRCVREELALPGELLPTNHRQVEEEPLGEPSLLNPLPQDKSPPERCTHLLLKTHQNSASTLVMCWSFWPKKEIGGMLPSMEELASSLVTMCSSCKPSSEQLLDFLRNVS